MKKYISVAFGITLGLISLDLYDLTLKINVVWYNTISHLILVYFTIFALFLWDKLNLG